MPSFFWVCALITHQFSPPPPHTHIPRFPALTDVTSVSVSKAPYLWTYLGAGIVLAAGGGYLATKFMIPGVIVLVVGVVLLAIFAYYALFPV